jgi:uncharacterized protein involved in exopolysaccharide biosynthesis
MTKTEEMRKNNGDVVDLNEQNAAPDPDSSGTMSKEQKGMSVNRQQRMEETINKIGYYLRLLWQERKVIAIVNGIVFAISVLILIFVVRPYYESTITILPDYGNKSTIAGLSELAASITGMDLAQSSPTEIYENIVYSDAVLQPVAYTKYKTESFKGSVNLIQYFDLRPDADEPPERRELTMYRKFFKSFSTGNLSTNVTGLTKILTITVTMPESRLSADVANRIAQSLDEYIRTKRKSFASDQKIYIEKRLSQVKDSLTFVENMLKQFRQQNRVIGQSPELMLEQARLERNVETLSTVYIQLTNQYELAKLDEIKDTPVLNVREEVTDPVYKKGPPRTLILGILMLMSLLCSCIYFIYRDQLGNYWRMFSSNLRR